MMDKTTTPNHAQHDVHFFVKQEAESLHTGATRVRDTDNLPAINALLSAARAAAEKALPDRFNFDGKTYFLNVSLGLCRIKVFDDQASVEPLVESISGGFEEFGHTPQQ